MCWDDLIESEQPATRQRVDPAVPRPVVDVVSLMADRVIVPTRDALPEPIEAGARS